MRGHAGITDPRIASMLLAAWVAAACDAGPRQSTVSTDSKAARAAPRPKGEQQAELIAQADAEMKAGNVEPAIAAYLDAEKVGALNADHARALAAALRKNSDALMTKGEPRRALANLTKSIAVAPDDSENATALGAWLVKWDEANALYSEDALATSVDEDVPDDLPASVKSAIAGVYIEHAKRLAADGRSTLRATRVFELAKTMDEKHPQLQPALAEAAPKLAEQMRAAAELEAAVDGYSTKHPGDDGIAAIAARKKIDADIVRAAVETIAARRQGLLDELQATSWGVVAGVEASVVRRTKLGENTAELEIVLAGCDPADHDVLASAALSGIVAKLPAGLDSFRGQILYKGLSCSLTRTGIVASWRRGDRSVALARG